MQAKLRDEIEQAFAHWQDLKEWAEQLQRRDQAEQLTETPAQRVVKARRREAETLE